MKRLSDSPAEDRLAARAQVLIRAMGRTVDSEERLRRVRRSLDAPAPAAASRWGGWRVGLALGLLGLSAAAAAGRATVSRVLGFDTSLEAPAAQATSTGRAKLPTAITAPNPLPERAAGAVESRTPSAPATTASGPSRRAPLPPLSDVARVHEAAKALRHDGDAERALQLLERGRPVTGPLAEEALALRIEASMARGNGRQAKLAAAYLGRYPHGRYRELAKKALLGSAP